jgi:hypothetical protein
MNDQDHSLSLSDPDRSLVLSHFLTNFLQNLASCHRALSIKFFNFLKHPVFCAIILVFQPVMICIVKNTVSRDRY